MKTEEIETILIDRVNNRVITTEPKSFCEQYSLIDTANNRVITTVRRDDGSILKTEETLDDWEEPQSFLGEMGHDLAFFLLILFRVCLFLLFVFICGIVSFYLWNAGKKLLNYLGM